MAKDDKKNEIIEDLEGKDGEKEASVDLEKVKEEVKKILEDARKEADKIMSDAKEAAKERIKNPENKPDPLDEPVEIELFYDGDKYKDDVFVGVNGRGYQIKRGVKVKVPKKVALVLEESEKQDRKTAALIRNESEKFRRETQKYE